jgi:hypothetical protein
MTRDELQKEELRTLLAIMRSESRVPMSQQQWKRLGQLSRKYKYAPEFYLDPFVTGVKG